MYRRLSTVHWPVVDEPSPNGVCLDDYFRLSRPATFEEDENGSESETEGLDNKDDELDGDLRTRENWAAFVQWLRTNVPAIGREGSVARGAINMRLGRASHRRPRGPKGAQNVSHKEWTKGTD
jgi:hypothetical protein